MTTLKPYAAYKDSGLDWLDVVPEHWSRRKFKALSRSLSGGTPPMSERQYWEHEVPWVSPKDMKRPRINNAEMWISRSAVEDGRTGYVPENALLMVVRSGILRRMIPVGVTTRPVAFNQDLKGYVFQSDELLASYAAALITSNDHEFLTLWRKYGATVESLEQGWVDNTWLPVPPLDEQRAIADFLDGMDARITRFIAARRKMIALLEEKKQAVINQAVTRGLDPDVPMKDSGVDWLGEIPAHWETASLRQVASVAGGMTPTKSRVDYWQGDIPWVSPKDMKRFRISDAIDHISESAVDDTGLSMLQPGAVLIVVRGMILARKIPVAIADRPLTINQDMKALISNTRIEPEYLCWLLTTAEEALFPMIDQAGHGTRRLPTPALMSMGLPIPHIDEQIAITHHIDHETSRVDALIWRHQREIELIQEYRTRLISDVVTGKLDVRGVELPAVEEVIGEEIQATMEDEPVIAVEE